MASSALQSQFLILAVRLWHHQQLATLGLRCTTACRNELRKLEAVRNNNGRRHVPSSHEFLDPRPEAERAPAYVAGMSNRPPCVRPRAARILVRSMACCEHDQEPSRQRAKPDFNLQMGE